MSRILGLSFFYHDAASALVVNGVPVAMAEEERFSRKKHDAGFPSNAISFVLQQGGIKPEELDWVVFYEKPFLKFDRIFKTSLSTFPFAPLYFSHGLKNVFTSKLWIRETIAKKVGVSQKKILFAEHHLSHAASAFFASPFEQSAILTIDGVGEWACATIGKGEGNNITILKEIHFPHSLGLLYSAFTAFLGFEVNEGEYKVMGMAPYGKPKYADKVRELVHFFDDGSFSLNLKYFAFHHSTETTFSKAFCDLFGKPRERQSQFFTRATGWPSYFGPRPDEETYRAMAQQQEYYADIAASVQQVVEEGIIRLARHAKEQTGMENLCYAGGVALNSVANWKVAQQTSFREVFIQPAAGDGGGALGAALVADAMVEKNERKFCQQHALYGKSYGKEEIQAELENTSRVSWSYVEDEQELCEKVAAELAMGRVAGWFQGRFEWGPRALGARSIVADPRREAMKDLVNTKIKFREPYRPFAPSVLAEHAAEFFELAGREHEYPFRFMLYVVPVKKEKEGVVPAITHVDGTARPQLVHKDTLPLYWKLIHAFYEKTGVPMVLNTSFNLKGEPIVNTPANALSTFQKSGLDLLVLGNFLVYKS
ncbi:MAG TPA: carbamoyltransferase N-terminal domain-containing protein [Candidatus Paceibacterota bacterium]|nr:carbamoyltransferase N-terminal domain-containing protein [Candidatus Paceibacterota bacterium]